jgi:hypothetical protein
MTVEQKLDIVLNHLKLRFELNTLIEEKNNAVKIQDFKQAVIIREQEVAKAKEYQDNAQALVDLLNSGTAVQECDASKAPSMREPLANNSPKEEDVEKMAEDKYPYGKAEFQNITVIIQRAAFLAGYNAAKTTK